MSTLGRDYETQFHVKLFLEKYYSSLAGSDFHHFHLQQRHHFFEKYCRKWDRSSAKMLEFGGGPVISNIISAAPYVQKIVLATYLEREREEIALWKNGTEDAHDWSPFFKYVVGDLESKPGEAAWLEREALLRSRVTITSCDITQESPIEIAAESEAMPYSIICTSLCLEAACNTYDEYKAAVKKLAKLLKPGGYLVMHVVERETYYTVGQYKFSVLYLTLDQIKGAVIDAGFDILMTERDPTRMQQIQNPTNCDNKSRAFIAAFKVKF